MYTYYLLCPLEQFVYCDYYYDFTVLCNYLVVRVNEISKTLDGEHYQPNPPPPPPTAATAREAHPISKLTVDNQHPSFVLTD